MCCRLGPVEGYTLYYSGKSSLCIVAYCQHIWHWTLSVFAQSLVIVIITRLSHSHCFIRKRDPHSAIISTENTRHVFLIVLRFGVFPRVTLFPLLCCQLSVLIQRPVRLSEHPQCERRTEGLRRVTLRREICGRQREGVAGKEGRLVRRGRAVERTGRVRSGGGSEAEQ